MKLKTFFEKYPVTVAGLARYMGKDRQWLNCRLTGVQTVSESDLKLINDFLHKLSDDFKSIEIE